MWTDQLSFLKGLSLVFIEELFLSLGEDSSAPRGGPHLSRKDVAFFTWSVHEGWKPTDPRTKAAFGGSSHKVHV